MLEFIIEHRQLLLTIYGIGAAVVFIATAIFLIRGLKEEREECIYPDSDYHEPRGRDRILVFIVVLAISALLGILWIGLPVITGDIVVLDWIQGKYPHVLGDLNDKEDQ